MKIIITGATGSLGGALTRYFASHGHEVIATGRMNTPPKALLQYATYIQADIVKPFTLPEADVCIHAAALSDDKAEEKQLFINNVTGTENVLKATASCKKFIHVSSSSVYAPSDVPITENLAGGNLKYPLSPYGKSKFASEAVVRSLSAHPACFILRPRALYGIGDKMILSRMFKLVKNEKLVYPGTMNTRVSMTHYTNFCHAIELCINANFEGIHTYNICDEKTYLLIDILRQLTTTFYGKPLPEKNIPLWMLKLLSFLKIGGITPLLIRSLTKDMVLDITKIKTELNYKAKHDFDSELDELITWIKQIGGIDVLRTGERYLAWAI